MGSFFWESIVLSCPWHRYSKDFQDPGYYGTRLPSGFPPCKLLQRLSLKGGFKIVKHPCCRRKHFQNLFNISAIRARAWHRHFGGRSFAFKAVPGVAFSRSFQHLCYLGPGLASFLGESGTLKAVPGTLQSLQAFSKSVNISANWVRGTLLSLQAFSKPFNISAIWVRAWHHFLASLLL